VIDHLGIPVRNHDASKAFYLKALAPDNGPPGIRAHYHPNYYGAFVIDPNGVNLEAACQKPQ
jgi:hypothetical protein